MISSTKATNSRMRSRVLALTAASTVAVVIAVAASPGLATASSGDDQTAPDRVLQSVAVTMAPDGTLTRVKGTTVARADGADEASSTTKSYSPQDAQPHLPVRVLTAYRTKDAAGTDLSDLSGYTGRVQIDLTVQNLTMMPQTLEYDVDGSSHSRAALVGAPLTVVASTALKGVEPSAVVTPSDEASDPATNGVLSQGADGTTQVQWATILAPPQIGPSATLSLVLDAKDLKTPQFDLSVQPGLVTDPSVGALVDTAFSPGDSSERNLQARTIKLVGEVNTVLARAGQTISRVRTTLDASATTLGTKTVGDLQSSATGVASSMKSLDGSVKSLGQDLSSSLESTRSSAVQQLLQTVTTLDTMLGDTSAAPQPVTVRGAGCAVKVAAPQKADSVYGNILQVAGQLSGFAKATGSCKSDLQKSILDSVGPAEPTDAGCVGATSVTCALHGARASFDKIAEDLVAAGDSALEALEPMQIDKAVAESQQVSDTVASVDTATKDLQDSVDVTDNDLDHLRRKLTDVHAGALQEVVKDLSDDAAAIHTAAQTEADSMVQQATDVADELCTMVTDNKISAEDAEQLRSYLVARSCDDSADLDSPDGNDPLTKRIQDQVDRWDSLVSEARGASTAASALTTQLGAVGTALVSLTSSVQSDSSDPDKPVKERLKVLRTAVTTLVDDNDEAVKQIKLVQDRQAAAIAATKAAFRDAAATAATDVSGTVDPQIRQVTTNSQHSREALGALLDQSASGLTSAADKVTKDGASTLEKQKKSFAQEQLLAGRNITTQVEQGLDGIAEGVSSSTLDMEAASAMLTKDLNRVLLDLGDRKVHGSGLLGSMTTGAATARSADYQLALATDTATSYANVRSADIAGLLLRQAQSDASLQKAAELPAFETKLPSGAEHRTVYTFHIGSAS